MRKIIVLERITLDGIFEAASMSEWDFPYHSEERMAVIAEGIHSSDAYLLGRTTFEMLAPGWSALKKNEMGVADKLNSMAKYVVSSSLEKAEWNNSTLINANVLEGVSQLKRQPGQNILVHGSAQLVQTLLAANLVDELQLLVHPIVLGRGSRFFKDGAQSLRLELVESRALELGVMLLRYQPSKVQLELIRFTLEQINDLHTRLGRAETLLEYARALNAIGVEKYDSYVTDGHSEFFGTGHKVSSPPAHNPFPIAGKSNREDFLRYLELSEQGKLSYVEMSRGWQRVASRNGRWIRAN